MKVSLGVAALALGFLGGAELQQRVASAVTPDVPARAVDPRARDTSGARDAGDTADDQDAFFEDCAPPPAGLDPDLVPAYGTNGRCGYVRETELHPDQPRDPGQAVRLTEVRDPEGYDVPLYAVDGQTVIGTFHVGPGRVLTSRAPEPSPSES